MWSKMKKASADMTAKAAITSKNTKEQISIQKKQAAIQDRKRQFGIEYLDILLQTREEGTHAERQLKECVDRAVEDIEGLKDKIDKYKIRIAENEEQLHNKLGNLSMDSDDKEGKSENSITVEDEEDVPHSGSTKPTAFPDVSEEKLEASSQRGGSANPFDEEEDGGDQMINRKTKTVSSSGSSNPFGGDSDDDDDDDGKVTKSTKGVSSSINSNPFDDDDIDPPPPSASSTNPFGDD